MELSQELPTGGGVNHPMGEFLNFRLTCMGELRPQIGRLKLMNMVLFIDLAERNSSHYLAGMKR